MMFGFVYLRIDIIHQYLVLVLLSTTQYAFFMEHPTGIFYGNHMLLAAFVIYMVPTGLLLTFLWYCL